MKEARILKCSLNDIKQLQKIGVDTFVEAFWADNNEKNMKEYLDHAFSLEQLEAELSDKHSEFFFAKLEDEVIGYLKINVGESQTEIKDENALEIERIYVLQKYHGKRVGQMLFQQAVDIAKKKGVEYIWLGVWEKNPRAIRFYKKNGFVEFDKHIFALGDDEQTDIMMKMKME